MGSESIGILVLVKSKQLVKKYRDLTSFSSESLFLPLKHYKYGGHFSLLVGYNI